MNATILSRTPRRAFTLVELLVVIIIIGMLAALATRAAMRAVTQAKNTGITLEIQSIGNAFESNIDKFGGAYPTNFGQSNVSPSWVKSSRLMSQLRRMYPRASYSDFQTLREAIWVQYGVPLNSPMYDLDKLDQAESIVFWLGGLPNPSGAGSSKLAGFSADVANPLSWSGGSRQARLFEFDDARLVDTDADGWFEYIPSAGVDTSPAPPYVYFDAHTMRNTGSSGYLNYANSAYGGTWGTATAYAKLRGALQVPVEDKKFQIISAGLDGTYGTPGVARLGALPIFPTGEDYQDGDLDNLTSFSDGTLQTALEAE